jgi:bla regulator protein BlaR1
MTVEYFSSLWAAIAPGVANHLWQSTLFAIAAGLLTLLLRKHHARARHGLWLAASLKFLLPFSLLVSIGSRLSPAPAAARASALRPTLYFAIEEISRPFSQFGVRATPAHAPSITSSIFPQLTQAAVAIWLVGFLAVLVVWGVRWRRISAAMRQATPLSNGREIELLRRMERIGGIRRPLAMLLSRNSLEPGIFGIARPVLVWPEGISQHLEDQHLEAILAHEIWHVRRRDNLFAALHMLVEAVFWFYPLVWWLGARLIDERERACDEEVVALGKDRQIYAESILKVCEFCLSSPLVCVSGVTGADLKKRMVHIMSDRILHKLDFARKLLLTAAAFLAIAVPVTFGLFHATPTHAQPQSAAVIFPKFASVSVKRNSDAGGKFYTKVMFSLDDGSFTARGVTLQRLIQIAYNVQDTQISGPGELKTEKFDIDARLDPAAVEAFRKLKSEQHKFDDQLALKALLSDRFKLVLHPETANLPAYDLVIADGGSKLQASKTGRFIHLERGELDSQGVHMGILTEQLSQILGQTVLDKTGLTGNYAFTLRWTPDAAEDARFRAAEIAAGAPAPGSPDPNGPTLITALEQQLGLKLESHTAPVQILVIDHFEIPSEN